MNGILDKRCRNEFKDASVKGTDRDLFRKAEVYSWENVNYLKIEKQPISLGYSYGPD